MVPAVETREMSPTESAELNWLLHSGALGRSANLTRVLKYLCDETAAGRGDQIKEYSIAVEALGRRPNFDPQQDTIVRVIVHTLRKRLQEVYQRGEGVDHEIRLVVPPGRYAVEFLAKSPKPAHQGAEEADLSPDTATETAGRPPQTQDVAAASLSDPALPTSVGAAMKSRLRWIPAVGSGIVLLAGWMAFRHFSAEHAPTGLAAISPTGASASAGPLHFLVGTNRKSYVDRSGFTWTSGNFCQGGESLPQSELTISGTEDPYLYSGGGRGMLHCVFPMAKGSYEMHLYFAEPTELQAAQRSATVSINAGPPVGVDVVDRAGGNHTATGIVIPNIQPENDGSIHLDYTSEVSPLNAVEIVSSPSGQPLPVRIVASSSRYIDDQKQTWSSDRFFSGGRRGQTPDQEHRPDLGLYESNRVGHFRYSIPVAPDRKYRVRLYFREPWFGQDNGASGGPGSRVFDVACNGTLLLNHFDILAEGHGAPLVKTFDNIAANSQGLIELSFMPEVNYPIVNAIEILPQP